MTMHWYSPLTARERMKRLFSFLNLGLAIFIALFIFSEFRFDWCETLLGKYLAATNAFRPETGSIWKTGRQTMEASRFLNDIVQKKQQATRKVEQASSFSELSSAVLPGEWITLETDHFKTLYRSLPQQAAWKLISPARLVWLLSGQDLDRIFCEGLVDGMTVYFLDNQNRVIHQMTVSRETITRMETGQEPIALSLDEIDSFSTRIFPAHYFFEAVFSLPEAMIPDLMMNPGPLLDEPGRLTRVGIGNEARAGVIDLGFEFEHNGRKRVVLVRGREWAVWQLTLILKGEA